MNFRHICILLPFLLLLIACGNRRLTPADVQQKLDSIARLENLEQLEARGIHVDRDVSYIQLFYDSLNIQPLPLRYTDEYVRYLPNYKEIPRILVSSMQLEGNANPKAIALPESTGARLIIVAVDEGDNFYSLWMYSLDDDYMPVDKLCLYANSKEEDEENKASLPEDQLVQDFIITSDYEIRLTDFSGRLVAESQKIYHIDMSRKFIESQEIDYEETVAE